MLLWVLMDLKQKNHYLPQKIQTKDLPKTQGNPILLKRNNTSQVQALLLQGQVFQLKHNQVRNLISKVLKKIQWKI